MILLFFSFCSSSNIHYFSFNISRTHLHHHVEHDISKLGNELKSNDQIFFIDSYIRNENAKKLFHMIEKCSGLSLIMVGFQTKIILNTETFLKLKNSNLTIKNITFVNCDSSYFKVIDSSFNLDNIRFLGKGHFTNKVLLNLTNCTSFMTHVYFKTHDRPLIYSNSSILFTQKLFFDNITINIPEHSVIRLVTTSFESSYTKLQYSNISHFLQLDNSNVFLSNLNSANSVFTSILLHSIFSNILARFVYFKKCQGPILSSVNDSTFHISNIKMSDHISEHPLFTVSNASLSVSDSQFIDSQINSIATLNVCPSFFFTNCTILYVMSTKTLFEFQKTNSAEFSQIIIYRLVSQTDIGIMHAINSDYVKISQALIEGSISQIQKSASFAFSDISSIYLDDFNYTQNGIPLMVVSQSNIVFANSYISKNDCIEYSKASMPSSFITLLTESSFHFINSQFIGNSIPGGFSFLSVDSIVFFMKITFSKNNAPIQFIQSDVKLSKSRFRNNFNRVIESHFSNVNIYKCLFSTSKNNVQIFAGNESKITVNTTIVNSSSFIEADPSASSITIGTGRFLYSYKKAIVVDKNSTRLFLFDTQFNCSVECEKIEMKSGPTIENKFIEKDENELPFIQTTQILLKNVNGILNNEDQNKSEKNEPLAAPTSPFLEHIERLFMNRQGEKAKIEQITSNIQITSNVQKSDERQIYKENTSIISLPNAQMTLGYQLWIVVFPIFLLCTIIIYRFKSQRFRKMSKKVFSQKGRYQL